MNWFNHNIYGTANPNVTAAGTVIIGKAPGDANGGGVTIHEVVASVQSGTATFKILDLGATGTVAAGTVCSLAVAQATRAPFVGTPAGYWLDGGNYLGVEYPVGTVVPPASISVGYRMGR